MTNDMTVDAANVIIGQNVQTITTFMHYVNDIGIRLHLVEMMLRGVYDSTTDAKSLLNTALQHLEPSGRQTVLDAVIEAAPSFAFIVQYAGVLGALRPTVLSHLLIPSEKVLEAVLVRFHDAKQATAVS